MAERSFEWLKINSLTGELAMKMNKTKQKREVRSIDEIECEVVASTLVDETTHQRISAKVSVKILVRWMDQVKTIKVDFSAFVVK